VVLNPIISVIHISDGAMICRMISKATNGTRGQPLNFISDEVMLDLS
jgi:hypothetical protein